MTQGAHAFLPSDGNSILRRHAALPDVNDLTPDRTHFMPDTSQVFIDWAGRLRTGDVSFQAIAQARTGDPVALSQQNGRWWVKDRQGRRLIGMKGGWGVPDGRRVFSAVIGGIIARHANESGDVHRGKLQQDRWEVVLPEIILE
jgi:ATP-dependent DNA helicase RecQ